MIRIRIEKITTRTVNEKKNYVKTEEIAKDAQGNPVIAQPEYGNRGEAKFNRTYELVDEPRQVSETVTLMEQTVEDAQFDIARVIMAINKISGNTMDEILRRP